jgi:hypothetical protein
MYPRTGAFHAARGAALAFVTTLLAAVAHVASGGHLPPLPSLAVGGVVLAGAFMVLTDKRRGLVQVGTAAGGAQLVFPTVFLLCGNDGSFSSPSTVVFHATVAVLVAALAIRGDSLIWAIADVLRFVGVALLVVLVPDVPQLRPAYVVAAPAPATSIRTTRLRGPPSF